MLEKIKNKIREKKTAAVITAASVLAPISSYAEEPTGLTLEFDFQQMFDWANTIISAMMPVVYITMGISLAFLIVRALKSAFN